MIVGFHFWNINKKQVRNQFISDWKRYTKEVAKKMGNKGALLFQLPFGNFVSVAVWKDFNSWNKWLHEKHNSDERVNWRNYKSAESKIYRIGK